MAIVAPKRGELVNVYCKGIVEHGPRRGQRCNAFLGAFRSADGGRPCHSCRAWNEINIEPTNAA